MDPFPLTFIVPPFVATYIFWRINRVRKIILILLYISALILLLLAYFLLFLINFGGIHTNGIVIDIIPEFVKEILSISLKLFLTSLLIMFANTVALSSLYSLFAYLLRVTE